MHIIEMNVEVYFYLNILEKIQKKDVKFVTTVLKKIEKL